MSGENRSARARMSEGIRQGLGVLSAFKDALEETIEEARERGDLSSERAKEVMKEALGRAQEAAGEARERLDFVSQKEFDALAGSVDRLRDRLDALDARFRGEDATGWHASSDDPGASAEDDGDLADKADPGPSS